MRTFKVTKDIDFGNKIIMANAILISYDGFQLMFGKQCLGTIETLRNHIEELDLVKGGLYEIE